jgi:hypothetical protein
MRSFVIAAGILCLLFCSGTASADSADVVTLDFVGSGICALGTCGTGTPDTSSVVGPWSFSTPFGNISSTDPGAYAGLGESESIPPDPVFHESPPGGYDLLYFGDGSDDVQLGFADPNDYFGSITPAVQSGPVTFIFSDALELNGTALPDIFDITSGTATPAPEPSSLILLGIGLLGLPLLRVRLARRVLS